MKRLATASLLLALSVAPALAQTTAPANTSGKVNGTNNNAVNTDNTSGNAANTKAPAVSKGANSYTESQARDRIAQAGYTDVQNLKLDNDGIWKGTAMKGGARVAVMLDFKGNVAQQR